MKALLLLPLLGLFDLASAQVFGRCFTPRQERGECIYFKSCGSLWQLFNKRPASPQDRLYISLSQCGFRDGQPLVCCTDAPAQQAPQPTQPPFQPVQPQPVNPGPAPPPNQIHSTLLPKPGDCGVDAENRIYGGNVTAIDEYPWMVLLQYSKPNNRKGFHCGGVLINSRYVLTASHCVNGKDLPTTWSLTGVRLGEWDTAQDVDTDDSFIEGPVSNNPPLDVPIEEKIPHEQYDPQAPNQHNDIALLRLSQDVTFTTFIKPICLPTEPATRDNNFVGQSLSVAGWGKTEKVSASSVKLKVIVDGVSNDACQKVYASESRQIIDSQVCAGGKKGFDSCRGDSGGPLMRQNVKGYPPYFYLAGLVSYGPSPCGMEGWPGVYTRVSKYVPWVESHLRP